MNRPRTRTVSGSYRRVYGSPFWVGTSGWPHLNDVIDEAREWYFANRYVLPNPDGFPRLGLRRRTLD
jgi:hypothetical protein